MNLRLAKSIGVAALCCFGLTGSARAEFPCLSGCLPSFRAAPAQPQAAPAEPSAASAAPAQPQQQYMAAAAPTTFAAPAPVGEVVGARKSIALPSVHFSLPKISFETPEFRINGFARSRREAHMQIDGAVAPVTSGSPLLYGQLPGATLQHQQFQGASAASSQPAEPTAASAASDDRCALMQESAKVQELTDQVTQLQQLVQMLAEAKGVGTAAPPQQPAYNQAPPPAATTFQAPRELTTVEQQMEAMRRMEEEYRRKCQEVAALQARLQHAADQNTVRPAAFESQQFPFSPKQPASDSRQSWHPTSAKPAAAVIELPPAPVGGNSQLFGADSNWIEISK